MRMPGEILQASIAEETQRGVDPAVLAFAEGMRRRHGTAVAAILFYGSCLRQAPGRMASEEAVLDFYLLVDSYRGIYGRWLPAVANRLLPPNVFYLELPVEGRRLRAKYAVITVEQFARGTSRRSFHASLWARFAQPVRILYARDATARDAVVAALSDAVATMVARIVPLLDRRFRAEDLWTRGFQETYRAELRAEGQDRAREIYRRDAERYDRLTPVALGAAGYGWAEWSGGGGFVLSPDLPAARRRRLRRLWIGRRIVGKLLNLLRLIKGVFTFEGGMDYILWKIERHSGVRTTATPWQRRHPLLSSPVLAWRLYRRGAFR